MAEDFINTGTIVLGGDDPRSRALNDEQTIIISGVARSGTSMVARVLAQAGLYLGETMDNVVFEDLELFELFSQGEMDALRQVIARRNQSLPVWGFKRPHIHVHGAGIIDLFRKPRVILTFRDPIAVAGRNVLSEQYESAIYSLEEAVLDQSRAMQFAISLTCPVLLVSYEKAIQEPTRFVNRLLSFCGLQAEPDEMVELLESIEPGREVYRHTARRRYEGYIDALRGNTLFGWAWQVGMTEPLELTLLIADKPVLEFSANGPRKDLADAGFGHGHYGFAIDISPFRTSPQSNISVKIRDRSFRLTNSDRSVASWRQFEEKLA